MPAGNRSPAEISLHGKLAALSRWSREDAVAGTAAARKASLDRFERQVDPDGQLDPVERAKRAERARKAYFTGLALKSAQARRKNGRGAQ